VDVGYNHHSTTFFGYLGTDYVNNGATNGIHNIIGVENTFTSGDNFAFPFDTDPDYMVDVLSADEGTLFFTCQNELGRSVYYNQGSYRTICTSSIFGAMADAEGTNTKADLMARYFSFLSNDPDPHIWSSTDELDFGIQYLNYPQDMTFLIRNLGYVDLNVSFMEVIGDGFAYTGASTFDLGWGEQTELEITFTSENIGIFNATLSIQSNDPELNPLLINLTGECVYPPDIELSTDYFTVNLEPGSIEEEILTISNIGNTDLSYVINFFNSSILSRGFGGPDNYGYQWIDSNELDGPVYNWHDITQLGTLVTFTHNDVGTDLMPIGFDFNFYGSNYSEFRINPNGWIGFGDDWTDYHNYELPRLDAPRPAIFGFWDDLDPPQGGNVYYYSTPDSLIVLFDNVIHYQGLYTGTYDFQMIIYANGRILFQYHQVSGDLDTATIGIQNEDASDGLQVVYNAPYVENELAVLFYSGPTWLEISNCAGTIPADSFDDITFTFNATDMSNGTYEAEVVIVSNDPDESEILIPITMNVGYASGEDDLPGAHNKLLGNYPNPFNPSTTISFSLTAEDSENAEIIIYNVKGQKVKTLECNNHVIAETTESLSHYSVVWHGKDDNGKHVSSGIYLYKLKSVNYTSTKKMILMK
jgi:hypothetical protein